MFSSAGRGICLTTERFWGETERDAAQAKCKTMDAELCDLGMLSYAWQQNYADGRWGMYDVPGRDARVTPCGKNYSGDECYTYKMLIIAPIHVIPNTPRPSPKLPAWCCK